MNNTKQCNSLAFELGGFYTLKGSYIIYRYVGMYGSKRVFMRCCWNLKNGEEILFYEH